MKKYDAGRAVDIAFSNEVLPFRRFVLVGDGPIQSKVLSRFLHALNNLLTVANGYVSLLAPNPSGDASLRELHREAVQAGERAATVSQALQNLMIGQSATDELQPVFVDELIRKIEPLLSAVTERQVPLQLDLSLRVGPVLLNPSMFLRAITACVANAFPDRSPHSISFTVCWEESIEAAKFPKAHLRIASMAQPGEGPGPEGPAVEELNELLRTWNGEARNVPTPGTDWDLRMVLPVFDEQSLPLCNGLHVSPVSRPCWRVVIVEEDPTQLRQLEPGLLDAGLAVASFTRGSAALESVRKNPHHSDLVITDIRGADLTGRELAWALRMESPCTHDVFSTSGARLPMAEVSPYTPSASKAIRHRARSGDGGLAMPNGPAQDSGGRR